MQVQSRADTGLVGKLAYRGRGLFIITKELGNNSFEVQRYGEPDSAVRKYKNTELYLLPPALFPSEVLDTIDERYIDSHHAPIVSPLLKPMRVELYNDKWLQSPANPIPTRSTHVDLPSSELDAIAFTPSIPTVDKLHINGDIPPVIEHTTERLPPLVDAADLHESITRSKDKLFFINYTPAGTMMHRWFLIQVDMESSATLQPDYAITSTYYCIFLAKHSSDKRLSDEFSRWWPDWYKYSRDTVSNDIVYGDRILFRPNMSPDSTKYIQWADTITLRAASNILLGPFNFEAMSPSNRTRNKIAGIHWRSLHDICNNDGILPPTTGSLTFNASGSSRPNTRSRKRKNKS